MKKVDLYGDGIGAVEYISHMGNDLSIVNAARVSFGAEKQELDGKDMKLIKYLVKHITLHPLSTAPSLCASQCLFLYALSIIGTALGLIMRSADVTLL